MINPGTPRIQSKSGTIRYLLLEALCDVATHSRMRRGRGGDAFRLAEPSSAHNRLQGRCNAKPVPRG
jgi:hypothetical protein